jgi:hypothetical protein
MLIFMSEYDNGELAIPNALLYLARELQFSHPAFPAHCREY